MSPSWSWVALAYVLGLATLPAVVFAAWAFERWGSGWTTHRAACSHGGPPPRGPGLPRAWALSWRCCEVVDEAAKLVDFAECRCRGRWVRGWVARLVPNRVLWPDAVRVDAWLDREQERGP